MGQTLSEPIVEKVGIFLSNASLLSAERPVALAVTGLRGPLNLRRPKGPCRAFGIQLNPPARLNKPLLWANSNAKVFQVSVVPIDRVFLRLTSRERALERLGCHMQSLSNPPRVPRLVKIDTNSRCDHLIELKNIFAFPSKFANELILEFLDLRQRRE